MLKTGVVGGGPEDVHGHGTGVSGLAVYGHVNECLRQRIFQPEAWVFSARVTDEHNQYDPDELLENQLAQAIRYFC